MTAHLLRRAPDIARHFVGIWHDHTLALKEAPLPYLDHLTEEILAAESMERWKLQSRLFQMTPELPFGTIRRVTELKYPEAGEVFARTR